MKKRSDFQGWEFDWFATDPDGCIALMASAGFGPIPDRVFERFEEQQRIEEFLSRLIGLPLSDDLRRVERLLSAAGVFVYDWRHWEGPYRRFDSPPRPQRLEELGLPPALRDGFVTVPERFCTSAELRPELSLPCTS